MITFNEQKLLFPVSNQTAAFRSNCYVWAFQVLLAIETKTTTFVTISWLILSPIGSPGIAFPNKLFSLKVQ